MQSLHPSFLAVLGTVLLIAGFPAKAQTLISFYNFDNSMSDSIRGASGDATVVHGSAAYAPGKIGQAFAFDGNTLIRSPLAGAGLSAFSISAWVNFSNTGTWSTIVKNWGATTPGAFHLGLDGGTGRLSNYMGTSGGTGATIAPSAVATGQWYHVMVTIGSGSQDLYVNGVNVATASIGGSLLNSFSFMSMGGKLNNAQNAPAFDTSTQGFLTGYLDDLAFFNGRLTPSQVTNLYTTGLQGESAVPEPSAGSLILLAMGGLAAFRRLRRRAVAGS